MRRIGQNSKGTAERLRISNLSLVIPTGFPTANQIPQTDADVQGNLLCEYEQKFADLPEQEKLTKLCSNAAFLKNIEKGQFFITLDDDTLDKLMGSCREDTLPRSDESSQVNGWIRGNTKTGPVLEVKDCYHQGRCGGDQDRTYFVTELVLGFES